MHSSKLGDKQEDEIRCETGRQAKRIKCAVKNWATSKEDEVQCESGRQAKRIMCSVQIWATSKMMKFSVKLGDKQRGLSAQLNNFECSRQKVHGDQKLL